MALTEQDVIEHFSHFNVRKCKKYLTLKKLIRLTTFRINGIENKYHSVKVIKSYPVGSIVSRLNRDLPTITLHDVKYSRIRNKKPIIVTCENQSLTSDDWMFSIGYQFREAIGLIYTQLQERDENTQRISAKHQWIQTPFLSFSRGDVIPHKSGNYLLQVEEGQRSGYENENLDHGLVRFSVYQTPPEGKPYLSARYSCNQFEFLLCLIFGDSHFSKLQQHTLPKN